jgi:hypothetical protein
MLSSWFRKNNNNSLSEFIMSVKKGERNFIKLLNKNEENFSDASFDELLSNENDVIVGVNRVQTILN